MPLIARCTFLLAVTLALLAGLPAQQLDLFVSSRNTHSVKRFDGVTGRFLGDFVASGAGGLRATQEVAFGPDGHLYVSGRGNKHILRFDRDTGRFLGPFTSGYELDNPTKMTFGPDGRLYVSQWGKQRNRVARFDASSGRYLDEATKVGLQQGMAHAWDGDGNMLVACYGSKDVRRFSPTGQPLGSVTPDGALRSAVNLWLGERGALFVVDWEAGEIRRFDVANSPGEVFASGLSKVEGVTVGPDGSLYACDGDRNQIHRFDAGTGQHLGAFAVEGGMQAPNSLVFGPRPRSVVDASRVEPRIQEQRVRDALGMRLSVLESKIRRSIIRTSSPYGFKIREVDPESPASRAGVQSGDLLMKWAGRPIHEIEDLAEWIEAAEPGVAVEIELARHKKDVSILSRAPWETVRVRIVQPAVTELDRRALDELVRATLTRTPGAEASVWLGGADGAAWYSWQADVARPAASAIKTAFLIELFARYGDALDQPVPGCEEILNTTPAALAPFSEPVRREIREQLVGASVRRLGEVMIRGTGVTNAVYNGAANLATAALGGPEALTRKIHARDPAFGGLVVRRYMLARRDVTGDNEATAASLAAALQRVASGKLSGVDGDGLDALRRVLRAGPAQGGGQHYSKSGSLNSDPMCRIQSGWWEWDGRKAVYVVTITHPAPVAEGAMRSGLGDSLSEAATSLVDGVMRTARSR